MRAGLGRLTALVLGMLVTGGTGGHAQERGATWLDADRIASWNEAGRDVPAAPDVEGAIDSRCRDLARPPQTDEDRQVQARGWDLVGAFQGGWGVMVVRGAATYDGMCRPMRFQDVVFVRGQFAGTLAPAAMDSRTDGALSRATLQGPTRLIAEYVRYDDADARCCPSRITSVTFDVAADAAVVRPLSASTSSTTTAAAPARDGSAEAAAPAALAGTSWRLIQFESGDGTVLRPADRDRYTIDFETDGRLAARIDCNRGRGTWNANGSGIQFGPLALTRAMCPPESLHDQIVRQWDHIGSYVIRNGHLFLALKADGGIYEFEPVTRPN